MAKWESIEIIDLKPSIFRDKLARTGINLQEFEKLLYQFDGFYKDEDYYIRSIHVAFTTSRLIVMGPANLSIWYNGIFAFSSSSFNGKGGKIEVWSLGPRLKEMLFDEGSNINNVIDLLNAATNPNEGRAP